MAQQIQVNLIDDISGRKADETLTFSLDGVTYEIDLSETNASKFREALAPYVQGRPPYGWPSDQAHPARPGP